MGVEYIITAIQQKQEELLYERWIVECQTQALHGYEPMSFDQYRNQLLQQAAPEKEQTEEEILENVKKILNMKGGARLGNI